MNGSVMSVHDRGWPGVRFWDEAAYLDKSRGERTGRKVFYLAFLSHCHETKAEQDADGSFRMVMVSESDFLNFVKCWVEWLQRFPAEDNLIESTAA
jgi:hypothetical protein